jgi:hypothetical protein
VTKQGQQTVVATEQRKPDVESREEIINRCAQYGAYQVSLAPELGDRSGTSDHAASNRGLRLKRILWACLPPVLRLLLTECRSLPHRIRVARTSRWDTSDGSPLVPEPLAKEMASLPGIRTYRHAYIRDMTRLLEQYPFLTDFDLHVARRMWNDGTQSCENTYHFCTLSDQSRSCDSESGNSMPPPEVQQSFNAVGSIPLPLRE